MPNYQPVSRERHADKRWERQTNYASVAADTVIPLALSELPKAVMSLPIAFIAQGDAYVPAAVLGLQPGFNVFVTPDWRWIGQYIPAFCRSSPFRLLKTENAQRVLCIDESIGLAADTASGEAFFADDGQPAPAVQEIISFLGQIEQSRMAAGSACAALQKHKLIRPWPITVKDDSGEKNVSGLFQIHEAELNQLSPEALHELCQAGALPVAYCQLLSMQHLPVLSQLFEAQANARAKADQQAALSDEFKASFFSHNTTISFSGLGG